MWWNATHYIHEYSQSGIPQRESLHVTSYCSTSSYSALGRREGMGPLIAAQPALQKLFVPTAAGNVGGFLDESYITQNDGFGV